MANPSHLPGAAEREDNGSLIHEDIGPRRLTVWLPPGYAASGGERYPVLYLQDGQSLLAPETAPLGWGLDRILARLTIKGLIARTVAVGIWNTEMRIQEYSPQKAFDRYLTPRQLAAARRTGFYPLSEPYMKYLVEELKPRIDAEYRTRPGREHTFAMGSSMGGVFSAYAVCEHPELFAGAACISTHWPIGGGVMLPYLEDSLPDPLTHRFYFDHGTEDMEQQYFDFQKRADRAMQAAGYLADRNWVTRVFAGHAHGEDCWRSRVDIPLRFLLGAA